MVGYNLTCKLLAFYYVKKIIFITNKCSDKCFTTYINTNIFFIILTVQLTKFILIFIYTFVYLINLYLKNKHYNF